MKIAVLGATGATGKCLLRLALDAGHQVAAPIRGPTDRLSAHERLHVLPHTDIFCADSLATAFTDCEAVVSALGFSRSDNPVTGYTRSARAICQAMTRSRVSRLIVMTSYFTEPTAARGHGFFINWVLVPLIRRVLVNMAELEQWLQREHGRDTSAICWTVVRPPGLTNNAHVTDKPMQVVRDAQCVTGSSGSMRMSRANVASFMLDQVDSDEYADCIVAIGM